MESALAGILIIGIASIGARIFMRRVEARAQEVRALHEAIKAADAERAKALKEIGESLDRIRSATSDLMRQEARRIVDKGITELEAAREKARQPFHA